MTEPKLCKNCKHFRRDWITFFTDGDEYAQCAYPKNFNLVNGQRETSYCSTERMNWSFPDVCGPNAKNFEEK